MQPFWGVWQSTCPAKPSHPSVPQNSTRWLFGLPPSTILCHNISDKQCKRVCKHMESNVVFLQNNCGKGTLWGHEWTCHVPHFLTRWGTLCPFLCHGLEGKWGPSRLKSNSGRMGNGRVQRLPCSMNSVTVCKMYASGNAHTPLSRNSYMWPHCKFSKPVLCMARTAHRSTWNST